ncbi:MAG: serine protease [Litorimonas sp.]
MQTLRLFALSMFSAIWLGATALASDTSVFVDQYRNSVVHITAPLDGRSQSGTGFVVSDQGHIVTAWHVVRDWSQRTTTEKQNNPLLIARGSHLSTDRNYEASVLEYNNDFALIKIMGRNYGEGHLPICLPPNKMDGETILSTGYPSGGSLQAANGTMGDMIQNGIYSFASAATVPGMSGGPVFSPTYKAAIGLVSMGAGPADKRMVPLNFGKSILDNHGVAVNKCVSEGASRPTGSLNSRRYVIDQGKTAQIFLPDLTIRTKLIRLPANDGGAATFDMNGSEYLLKKGEPKRVGNRSLGCSISLVDYSEISRWAVLNISCGNADLYNVSLESSIDEIQCLALGRDVVESCEAYDQSGVHSRPSGSCGMTLEAGEGRFFNQNTVDVVEERHRHMDGEPAIMAMRPTTVAGLVTRFHGRIGCTNEAGTGRTCRSYAKVKATSYPDYCFQSVEKFRKVSVPNL